MSEENEIECGNRFKKELKEILKNKNISIPRLAEKIASIVIKKELINKGKTVDKDSIQQYLNSIHRFQRSVPKYFIPACEEIFNDSKDIVKIFAEHNIMYQYYGNTAGVERIALFKELSNTQKINSKHHIDELSQKFQVESIVREIIPMALFITILNVPPRELAIKIVNQLILEVENFSFVNVEYSKLPLLNHSDDFEMSEEQFFSLENLIDMNKCLLESSSILALLSKISSLSEFSWDISQKKKKSAIALEINYFSHSFFIQF